MDAETEIQLSIRITAVGAKDLAIISINHDGGDGSGIAAGGADEMEWHPRSGIGRLRGTNSDRSRRFVLVAAFDAFRHAHLAIALGQYSGAVPRVDHDLMQTAGQIH